MTDVLVQRRHGRLALLTLNRPEQRNALSVALVGALAEALDRCAGDPAVGAVVVSGAPPVFCAGADLKEVRGLLGDPPAFRDVLHSWRKVFRQVEELPKPVIAAVNGAAIAGGLELLLACDVALASSDATLSDGHIRYGLVPGAGGSQRLPSAVGTRAARWLMYRGGTLDAQEALRLGLVQQVLPAEGFLDAVVDLVAPIADGSRAALAFMKRMTRDRGVTDDGLDLEIEATVAVVTGPEAREGLAAFFERRAPRFHPGSGDG